MTALRMSAGWNGGVKVMIKGDTGGLLKRPRLPRRAAQRSHGGGEENVSTRKDTFMDKLKPLFPPNTQLRHLHSAASALVTRQSVPKRKAAFPAAVLTDRPPPPKTPQVSIWSGSGGSGAAAEDVPLRLESSAHRHWIELGHVAWRATGYSTAATSAPLSNHDPFLTVKHKHSVKLQVQYVIFGVTREIQSLSFSLENP